MTEAQAREFVEYCKLHIKGDEKGEAQIFLDRFFMALGYEVGLKGAGATLEFRIKDGKKGSTKFADLVWKPKVLIEMKKEEKDLLNHYQQAFQYWVDLVPDRPQYVILCNFDEFWIYDFHKQMYQPVSVVRIETLAVQRNAFAFLFPKPFAPIFEAGHEDITIDSAKKVAAVFTSLIKRLISREHALHYCMQCVVAMFADSTGLLPDQLFYRLIRECKDGGVNSYDLIGGLFQEMNRQGITPAGRYRGVDYFNGGLFSEIIPIELSSHEIDLLYFAAKRNWRQVNPAIFGSIFEQGLEKGERHVLGAHYTHEIDIKKIVGPCIVKPWQQKIDAAQSLDEYYELLHELVQYKVLDPSCGSGNFLFVAFKELKLIERQLLSLVREYSTKPADGKRLTAFLAEYPFVGTSQFFGIDIKIFSTELAKVTLMVAKELAYFEFKEAYDSKFRPLPLDNLDANIVCADALIEENGTASLWPEVNVIIGNPPYQSKNKMQQEFGTEYVNQIRRVYPEINGNVDFCVYWYYKAHKHLKEGQFAGLVGTNTIRQNFSREGSLDYIVNHGGTIINAVSSQQWPGEAAVHVSIVNWIKGSFDAPKMLFLERADGSLEGLEIQYISSSLSKETDVAAAKELIANKVPKKVFQGQTHGHTGFLLEKSEATALLKKHPHYAEVLKPFLIGKELVASINAQPERFVIDFTFKDVNEAASYQELFKIIQKEVLPERRARSERQLAENATVLAKNKTAKVNKHHVNFYNYWWKHSYGREDMLAQIIKLQRYIACSRVSLRPIFEFVAAGISPNDALMVFAFDDNYSFGIIQSNYHWEWWKVKCSTLGQTYRYTADTVWDTFPWPQNPSAKAVNKVAEAAIALQKARTETMRQNKLSFRDLYRILDQPGKNPIKTLQDKLDDAVRQAYNFPKNSDILTELLALNLAIAQKEANGEEVTAPGLPSVITDAAPFVTDECVRFDGSFL